MGKNFAINIKVSIPFITKLLGAFILLCIGMAFFRGLIIYFTGVNAEDGLLFKFNMDLEQTLPTYVATINLFIASVLLALVCKFKNSVQDKYWRHWGLLSIGFLFLSIDENISLHEILVRQAIAFLDVSAQAHFGAGLFIVGCALVSGLFFLKFLLHLPNKTKIRFIMAGVVFVLGAAGMEAIGGYILSDGYHSQKVAYNLGVIIEESMELIGVLLFIRAVLIYIKENLLNATSLFHEAPAIPEAAPKSNEAKITIQEEQLI